MTADEARAVGRIACQADGGCSECARDLVRMLQKRFPEHATVFGDVYLADFDYDLEGE
jgi:hypothetical protein